MKLTRDNYKVLAGQAYTNPSCVSVEEFEDDLSTHLLVKRLAGKIARGSSKNLRLLTNHVVCFANNFELPFVKQLLLFETDPDERSVILSVMLYLGYLNKHEYSSTELQLNTLKLLKEMDKNG